MRPTAIVVALVSSLYLGGCGGAQDCRYFEAALNVALAATLWATAGGCKIAGCTANMRCNRETELCEPIERPPQKQYPIQNVGSTPEQ
jgi:hypothetical protein